MKAKNQAKLPLILMCLLALLVPSLALAQVEDGGNRLVTAEAFLDDPDTPPGTGTALSLTVDPELPWNEARDAVDLTEQEAGVHTIYVRFQDAYGDWSEPVGQSVYIPEGSLGDGNNVGGANRIQTAEAFFDTDPGPGAGVPIAIPVDGAIDTSNEVLRGLVDLTGVTPGQHTLYWRFQDTAGVWSPPLGQSVTITPELIGSAGENKLGAARVQIDAGPAGPAPAQDGLFDDIQEEVDFTETVSSAYHSWRVWFQNSAGHWSLTESPLIEYPIPEDDDGPVLGDIRYDGVLLSDGVQLARPGAITLNASDLSRVSRVEFFIGATAIGYDSNGADQYSAFWSLADFPDGPQTLRIAAYDTLGNLTEATFDVTVALAPPAAPAILQPASGLVTNQSTVAVSGTAEKGSTVRLYRNGALVAGPLALSDENAFASPVVLLEGQNNLQAAAENRGGVGPMSAVVPVVLDSSIPPAPTGLFGQAREGGQVRLTWSRVSDPDVAGYAMYRATQPFTDIGQAQKLSSQLLSGTTFDDLPPGDGLYYYRVVAVNGVGTASLPSNQVAVTADATPPRAEVIAYAALGAFDPATGRMGPGRVNLTLTASEPLITTPFLTLTPDGGLPLTPALTKTGDKQYQGHFDISQSTPAGTAYAVFSARDQAGNRGVEIAAGGSVLIDTAGPKATITDVIPGDPIQVDPENPAAVQVSIELDEALPAGQIPLLSYQLSRPGRTAQAIPLVSAGERLWDGDFLLPEDAGQGESEALQFGFQAQDDLGNLGTSLEGQSRFQVYQGDLPPLAVPTGLYARALPGGEVELGWDPVEGAADYELAWQPPGAAELTALRRSGGVVELVDAPGADGTYLYAVASVREANGQEAVSAYSATVAVEVDSVPPDAPSGLTLSLVGAGIRAAWQAPLDESELTYNLYRAPSEIIETDGLTPVLTGITDLAVIDGHPSESDHEYAVTAVDPAGNESLPSESVYLNFDLLPVASLAVEQTDHDYPVVSWSHEGSTVVGYNLYLLQDSHRVQLNSALLTEPSYTDTGYSGDPRRYAVTAVDVNDVESAERQVFLPQLEVQLAASTEIHRGVMNRLAYQLQNGAVPLEGVRLQARVGTHDHGALPFDLAASQVQEISVIVGGYEDLADSSELVTTLEIMADTGEQTRIIRNAVIEVGDGALTADILTEDFTRGVSGTVRFVLHNTSDVEVEILTATNQGQGDSNEIRFTLQDADRNVLSTQSFRQVLGEGVITLADGRTVVRIPPGGTFSSNAIDLPVPLAAPDEVFAQLSVDQVHYRLGQGDQVSMPGLSARREVALIDVSYRGDITGISPTTSFGGEDIVINGRAIDKTTDEPMPLVPLDLVITVNGFERRFEVVTDASGAFTHTFIPLAGESGAYQVSVVHPDLLERPVQGQFSISRVSVSPSTVDVRMPRDYDQAVSIRLTAGPGTVAHNVHLVYDAADQPLGVLPTGLAVTLPAPLTLYPGQSKSVTVQARADDTAEASGAMVFAVKSDETGNQPLGKVRVNYQLSEATPQLAYSPSFIETGVARDDSVTETLTLENRGLAPLEGIELALVNTDGTPAPDWVFLTSPIEQADLAVGEKRPIGLMAQPSQTVAEGIYELRLRVTSANHAPAEIGVYVSVTQSGIGNALFHVSDIYTATIDKTGELVRGLAGAQVRLQNEEVLTVDQTLATDSFGEVLFSDLPAGRYKFRVSAPNHQEVIGRLWVKPGITATQEVFLDYDLVTVEWSVTEIALEDRYDITLNATYETDVPAAVVVTEPGSINLPEMQAGDVYYGEFTLTNYGLIRADDLNFQLPQDDTFTVELLSGLPTSLDAKQRITIPYRVTALKSLNQGADGGGGGDCQTHILTMKVTYVFECSNGTARTSTSKQRWITTRGQCTKRDLGAVIVDLLDRIVDDPDPGTNPDTDPDNEPDSGTGPAPGPGRDTWAPDPIDGVICWPIAIRYELISDLNLNFILFNVGCSANTVLREFNDEALDLKVKVPGGAVSVQRRFYANAWHWDHERGQLSFQKDPTGQNILAIAKGMVTYSPLTPVTIGQPDTQTVFENEHNQITVEPQGYLWQDKHGNWERFDLAGRLASFGLRSGTLATLLYPDAETRRPSGMADKTGQQVIWFDYDAQGHLSAAEDAAARRVQYHYTGDLLTGVTDAVDGETLYEYDANGRMTRKVDPAGRPTLIGYDSYGNVASVVGEDGSGSFFEYNYDQRTKERYAQIKTSAGKITEVWYDAEDEVKRVDINGRTFRTVEKDGRTRITTDEKGNVTREERDEWDNPARIVYPDGSQVAFEYDNRFHLVKRAVDLRGHVNIYVYDDNGNLTRKVEALGTADERATRYAYDNANQLLAITLEGDARTQEATTRFTYDAAGNIASLTDPEGNRTEFLEYDAIGNLLRMRDPRGYDWTFQYDALGRLVSKTDQEGNETAYEFDGANNPTAVIDADAKRFGFAYNDRNQVTRTTDPDGAVSTIDYNTDGLPTQLTDAEGKTLTHEYDNEERLLKSLIGPAASGYATRFHYDETSATYAAASLPVQIDYPAYTSRLYYDRLQRPVRTTDVLSDDMSQSTSVEYDGAGNVIARTDEDGRTTEYSYDALNRLVETRDPANGVTRYVYDDRGNLVSMTDANGGTTQLAYNRNGQLTTLTRPLGETTEYEYDAAGNRTAVVDAKGQRVEYHYSPANRLVQESLYDTADASAPVRDVTYSNDKLGRMTGYDDGTTSATYSYDDLGRKTGAAVDYGAFTLDYAYTYYANGQKETFTGPDGVTYRYLYDDAGRLSAIELPDGQRVTYNSYQWNSPTRMTLPGGLTLDYGYDPLQRLTSIDTADRLGEAIMTRDYTRSPIGNISAQLTEHGDYAFQYDILDRLTDVDHPALADEGYTYDALGNRLSAVGIDGSWSYDANNRLLGYADRTIDYDDNGNQTRGYVGATPVRFVYDLKDRLVRVEHEDGSGIAEYYYNPFGRRLWKDVNGVRTYYAYADEGLIGEYDDQGAQTRAYGYRPDSLWTTNPLFQKLGDDYYWYQNDQLGTPQKLVDAAGTVVWSAVYNAFGQAEVSLTQIQNNLRLPGQYFDAETGLHYNWHRYYDPQTGRYLSTDPLNEGLNPYLYALGNPLFLIDPEGTHTLRAVVGLAEIIGGALVIAGSGGLGTAGGVVLMLNGLDNLVAGGGSIATQESKQALLERAIYEFVPVEYAPWVYFATQIAIPYGAVKLAQIDQARAGVRELSQTLQNAGVPRAQRLEVINSFKPGTISARTSSGEYVIRFWGDSAERGRFVTGSYPQGSARSRLALPPGNSAKNVTPFYVQSGTRVFEGTVAPNFGLPGGGSQIFVPNLNGLVKP